jgi:hypothetical protein
MSKELEAAESPAMRWPSRIIPTVAAAISALTLLGFTALPASAASTAVAATPHSSAQAVTDVWVLHGSYPTLKACQLEGLRIGEYKCVGVTKGGALVWASI